MQSRIPAVVLLLALVAVLLMTAGILPLELNASTTIPLFEKTRKEIPGNLPWYPVIVIGDNRPYDVNDVDPPGVFYQLVNEAENAFPLAFIGLGDHVGFGTPEQYAKLYELLNKTRLENIWMVPGNHDVAYSGTAGKGIDFWRQYVGPDVIITDSIPGWRIALVNSEASLETWRQQLLEAFNYTGGSKLILGFHRPLYPDVSHNLGGNYSSILLEYMNTYGWPSLVLQAHWHGWVEYRYNGSLFIITGGAGAPLYPCSDVKAPEASCSSVYHYMMLILYPNGTFTYKPILLGEGSGVLKVIPLNSTSYLVVNSKLDIHGKPVEYPVRLQFKGNNTNIYVVALIPASSGVSFTLDSRRGILRLSEDLYYYVYMERSGGTVVIDGTGRELDLSQYMLGEEYTVVVPGEIVKAETLTSTVVAFLTKTRTLTETTTITQRETYTTATTLKETTTVFYPELQTLTATTTYTSTAWATRTEYSTVRETSTTTLTTMSPGGYTQIVIAVIAALISGFALALLFKRR